VHPRPTRLRNAIFLWLNLGTDTPASIEEARRIKIVCDAYGIEAVDQVIEAVLEAVATNIERLKAEGRNDPDVEWWPGQLNWLAGHRYGSAYAWARLR